jgi:hypothetical protein
VRGWWRTARRRGGAYAARLGGTATGRWRWGARRALGAATGATWRVDCTIPAYKSVASGMLIVVFVIGGAARAFNHFVASGQTKPSGSGTGRAVSYLRFSPTSTILHPMDSETVTTMEIEPIIAP